VGNLNFGGVNAWVNGFGLMNACFALLSKDSTVPRFVLRMGVAKSRMKDLRQDQFLLIPTAPAFGILHDVQVDFLEILAPVASQSVPHFNLEMEPSHYLLDHGAELAS